MQRKFGENFARTAATSAVLPHVRAAPRHPRAGLCHTHKQRTKPGPTTLGFRARGRRGLPLAAAKCRSPEAPPLGSSQGSPEAARQPRRRAPVPPARGAGSLAGWWRYHGRCRAVTVGGWESALPSMNTHEAVEVAFREQSCATTYQTDICGVSQSHKINIVIIIPEDSSIHQLNRSNGSGVPTIATCSSRCDEALPRTVLADTEDYPTDHAPSAV